MAIDREYGVCPIPLYEFSEKDWDLFLSSNKQEEIADRLKQLGIFQYFFPPPDQIALGLVDRNARTAAHVANGLRRAPALGHPYGKFELTRPTKKAIEIIGELKDMGLVVEGELGLQTTDAGASARATIKFRPREGLISKLSKIISLKAEFSLKDLFDK